MLMTATLLKAFIKQPKGIPFGAEDIDGSFTALVARGFIKHKNYSLINHIHTKWVVTGEAIEMLHNLGIEVSCYH